MSFTFGTSTPTTKSGIFPATASTTATTFGTSGFTLGGSGDVSNKLNVTPSIGNTVTATSTVTSSIPSGFSLSFTKPTSIATPATSTITTAAIAPTSITFPLQPTSSTGFTLPLSAATTTAAIATTVSSTTVTTSALASIVSSTPVSAVPPRQETGINFSQLEENINKWTLELEEQEKAFMNQAAQVNTWDRMLISNGEKIVNLNGAVERVKLEQQQLDHELDFIVAQQKELEECLGPLEKDLKSTGIVDPERNNTYQLAETLNSQLKQVSEDLKEIIEHLNECNRSQNNNDPLVQIGKILNAHMNSLQWIDQHTSQITDHLDQVTKLHDAYRRENERNLNLNYE